MPLQHSASQAAFKQNVQTLMGEVGKSPHVKDRSQALAIAYATKRRAGRKSGGRTGYDLGGFINPAAAPVTGPPMPQMGVPAPAPAPTTPMTAPTPAGPTLGPMQMTPAAPMPPPPPAALGGFGGMPAQTQAGLGGFGGLPFTGQNDMPNQGALGGAPFAGAGSGNMGGGLGMKEGGTAGYAGGGAPQMPWFAKSEARSMMHTGPINSIVPGRTDHIGMKVPSSSYVLPADHISSLGQGNTAAGHAVVNHMFGPGGPYGAGAMKIGHGAGAPRPPKLMGVRASGGRSDTGGARGQNVGTPTEIIAAGGEHVLNPSQVASVGGGDIGRGHKILDAWVKSNRQKHIRTLRKLPPPAKS